MNLHRRHLTDFQKVEASKPLEDLIAEKAKKQQGTRTDLTFCSNEQKVQPIDTATEVAKAIGVARSTYVRGKKVRDEGTEKEKHKARSKRRAINSAYRDVVKRQKREELETSGVPQLPEGEFDVIYADPPWDYDAKLRGEPDLHYPTMKLEDICVLKVPSADDSILFLWATNPKLKEALKVMEEWKFSYKTNMAWVKDVWGTGFYFRGQHELLLVGTKGNISPPPESVRKSSVLQAPRREHSEKPDEVYEIIESMYPNRKYVELFARNSREGWVSWGNEV